MNNKWIWCATIVGLLSTTGMPQNLEIAGYYGVGGYSGDMQLGSVDVLEIHPSYELDLRLNACKALIFSLGVSKFSLSGNDRNYNTLTYYRLRDLQFRNDIYEVHLLAELNMLNFGMKRHLSSAYLFAGAARFRSNLQIHRGGVVIDIPQIFEVEQSEIFVDAAKMEKWQWSLPAGVGFRVFPTERVSFGLQLGLRYALSDYLDGIRVIGAENPQQQPFPVPAGSDDSVNSPSVKDKNDYYFFGGLTISISVL